MRDGQGRRFAPSPLAWEGGDGGGVRVIIKNTGSGISEELRERIFEPFFSTKSGGTGLGLTIARRLIESHGGRIAIESDGASWTSFVVELPSHKEPHGSPHSDR